MPTGQQTNERRAAAAAAAVAAAVEAGEEGERVTRHVETSSCVAIGVVGDDG